MIKKAEPEALRHDFLNIRRESGRIFSMEEEKWQRSYLMKHS
jgi:hypothetical protein